MIGKYLPCFANAPREAAFDERRIVDGLDTGLEREPDSVPILDQFEEVRISIVIANQGAHSGSSASALSYGLCGAGHQPGDR